MLVAEHTKKQNVSILISESGSIKTEHLKRKRDLDEDQMSGKVAMIPELLLDNMSVQDAKRKGHHNRLRCFSNELPRVPATRESTVADEESAGVLSS